MSIDFKNGVPYVAEGTTFNIHGGRDMFAKVSVSSTKPPIAKKPSLDKIVRQRSFQKQKSLEHDK